jgi:predicted nucleic acid-binding protein
VSFLIDTNVVSEWVARRPNPLVVSWLAEVDEDRVFISVMSFAEIRRGIELLASGRRREQLTAWLDHELPTRFEARILPIDRRAAEHWGVIMVRGQKAGVSPGLMDAFFAATAELHQLTLVTRNTRDFRGLGIPLLNPWEPPTTTA